MKVFEVTTRQSNLKQDEQIFSSIADAFGQKNKLKKKFLQGNITI